MAKEFYISTECVNLSVADGVAFIAEASPLTRLHYFDGQYLRADSMALEQDYLRERNRLSNLAGGWGVVNGLGLGLTGVNLRVSAGFAITPVGNPVFAVEDLSVSIADLLKLAKAAPSAGNSEFGDCLIAQPAGNAIAPTLVYEITVGPVETLCGNEAVYGKLCATACASDSQRPWWREGVALRLRPITLKLPTSTTVTFGVEHLRNRAASAYFAAEPWLTASALSSAGLASPVWCNPASLYNRDEVPIGLLIMDGSTVRVLDAWSARRERMDTQARSYWQGRMAMRPWNVFVAQILQFQCQLAAWFDSTGGIINPADDCADIRKLLDSTRAELEALHKQYSVGAQTILKRLDNKTSKQDRQALADEVKAAYARLYEISDSLSGAAVGVVPKNRLLLNAGFVELPPAGYLPVAPASQNLETQLARMFGEGVNLIYRAVRHDEIAHLVEEAQHMERISLTRGLDDAKLIEQVEIFVPDGQVISKEAAQPGIWWQTSMSPGILNAFEFGLQAETSKLQVTREALSPGLADRFVKTAYKASTDTSGNSMTKLDATTQEEFVQKLVEIIKRVSQRDLHGLTRTESRSDGSYGVTLICQIDAMDLMDEAFQLLDEYPDADPDGKIRETITTVFSFSIYFAGDIANGPFDLAIGAQASLNGEYHLGGAAINAIGSVTAVMDRPLFGGLTERVLDLLLLAGQPDGKAVQARGRISLLRKSVAGEHELIFDDAPHDPSNSPIYVDWTDSPRIATLSVDAEKPLMVARYMSQPAAEAAIDTTSPAASAQERQQLMKLEGLSAMPALTSPLGAAALNALTTMASAADDSAFLAKATRRLFPAIDTPSTTSVRAVLDWVMFRRARTPICCPAPVTPSESALEAFQVWHLSVQNDKQLQTIRNALDKNDVSVLAKFDFKRVGVLRYRGENVISEEPDYQVLGMWRAANPGPQVLLGRYWEQAPATGQGWQNHFRLTNMLDQIAGLTTPPTAGSGAVAGLTAVSPPLANGSVDGGFVLVTLVAPAVTRNALLIYGNWDRPNHYLQEDAPRGDQSFIDNQPQGSSLEDFITALTNDRPVRGVTLATTQAAPGADTKQRLAAAVAALVAAGRPAPAASRQTIEALNDHDRQQLNNIGIQPDSYDEIIFFELNGGA